MKTKILLMIMLACGIAILSSCGGGTKPADDTKTDTVQTATNPTIDNLIAATKGETTAAQKYAAFAQKAREEKLNAIAIVFDALAEAEKIHAGMHMEVITKMGGKMPEFKPEFTVATTKENLQAAINGETEEFTKMYPDYINVAEEAGYDEAVASFEGAKAVEQQHSVLLTAALKALTDNKINTLPASYSLCPKCGMTYDSKKIPPEECEVCGTVIAKFVIYK
jgi:rubrerythrin